MNLGFRRDFKQDKKAKKDGNNAAVLSSKNMKASDHFGYQGIQSGFASLYTYYSLVVIQEKVKVYCGARIWVLK